MSSWDKCRVVLSCVAQQSFCLSVAIAVIFPLCSYTVTVALALGKRTLVSLLRFQSFCCAATFVFTIVTVSPCGSVLNKFMQSLFRIAAWVSVRQLWRSSRVAACLGGEGGGAENLLVFLSMLPEYRHVSIKCGLMAKGYGSSGFFAIVWNVRLRYGVNALFVAIDMRDTYAHVRSPANRC